MLVFKAYSQAAGLTYERSEPLMASGNGCGKVVKSRLFTGIIFTTTSLAPKGIIRGAARWVKMGSTARCKHPVRFENDALLMSALCFECLFLWLGLSVRFYYTSLIA